MAVDHRKRGDHHRPQQQARACNLCGTKFVGMRGAQTCRRCHGDYRLVRIAEHSFRMGWRAACEHPDLAVDAAALEDARQLWRNGQQA